MESQSDLAILVHCPLHPTEHIQKIDLNHETQQQFYCIECILNKQEESESIPPNLKSFQELVSLAAANYEKTRPSVVTTSKTPTEYTNLLSKQSQVLDKFKQNVKEEKLKVENIFEELIQDFLRIVNKKKIEFTYALDQQLATLRYWYIQFEKQVKKTYPNPEDLPFLFPSEPELVDNLKKVSDAMELMAFIRNIKEDLTDNQLSKAQEEREKHLKEIYKDLCQINEKRPRYEEDSLNVTQTKNSLKNLLDLELDKVFKFQDRIPDIKRENFPESKIAENKDFLLIKNWLPEGYKLDLGLLFRGTRDGMDTDVFHKLCDNKGPTLTLIKAKARKTRDIHIVGGFLDQDWQQDIKAKVAICSDKAFLFSVTSNLKCPVIDASKAAEGKYGFGPMFGEGPDLGVVDFNFNYSVPCSYKDSAKLFGLQRKRYESDDEDEEEGSGRGKMEEEVVDYGEKEFNVLEIEVYTVS